MSATRLDTIARVFAGRRRSHRLIDRDGLLAAASAQEATPAANDEPITQTEYLFVQSFQSGTIAPKKGEDGTFTLTLEHGLGQTVYFADRPSRSVGAMPTPDFLDGLGFSPDNPPNAALVVDAGNGETDVAVVTLTNPVFDGTGPGVTYDVTVLADYQNTLELGFSEQPADLATFPASFGDAHLFIDDCAAGQIFCLKCPDDACESTEGWLLGSVNFCWYENLKRCLPCEGLQQSSSEADLVANAYWTRRCNSRLDTFCNGICFASW